MWVVAAVLVLSPSVASAQDLSASELKKATKKCTKKGEAEACLVLARHHQGSDEGAEHAATACRSGLAEGCHLEGLATAGKLSGRVSVPDAQFATERFQKACDEGFTASCSELSVRVDGWAKMLRLAEDDRFAVHAKACELDDAEACARLTPLTLHEAETVERPIDLADPASGPWHQAVFANNWRLVKCAASIGADVADRSLTVRVVRYSGGLEPALVRIDESSGDEATDACVQGAFEAVDWAMVSASEEPVVAQYPLTWQPDAGFPHRLTWDLAGSSFAAACEGGDAEACTSLLGVAGHAAQPDATRKDWAKVACATEKCGFNPSSRRFRFGRFAEGAVQSTVSSIDDAVAACYADARKADSDLEGRLVVRSVLGPDGSMRVTRSLENTMQNGELERCVVGHYVELKYPAPKGGVAVFDVPFVFQSGTP